MTPTTSITPESVADLTAARYDQLLSAFDEGVPPLVIAVGLDSQFLDALERLAPTTKVLAIEPLAIHARALLDHPIGRRWLASGLLTVLVGPTYEGRVDAWRLIDRRAPSPPMIVSPELQDRFPGETAGARAVAKQIVLGALANEDARKRFAGRYLLNTLANLSVIGAEGDAGALNHLFADVPAIVIGAGPSLDRNLPALRALKDRAVLIAVDTALKPLLAADIRPHLVVSVDPSEIDARHLLDLPHAPGVWLVAEGSLNPQVFPTFEGRTFVYKVSNHEPWTWLAEHGTDRTKLQAWGSVLTTAFDVALRAGCDPIVFAGADLAYTDGLQYCRNTTFEGDWSHLPTDAERAAAFARYVNTRPHLVHPDLAGRDVTTAPTFIQFRDWLVAQATAASPRRVVNGTGGGILYGGRIEQHDLLSLDLPGRSDPTSDVRRHLSLAWTASVAQHVGALERLDGALRYGVALPFRAWFEFGGDSLTVDQIAGTAQSSGGGIAWALRKRAYLARHRRSYNQRIHSLESAQDLSHGRYDVATRRAPAQQAHVLLDFLQRTYPTPAPGVQNVLDAASVLPATLRALDVGCGAGQSMEAMVGAGLAVDGVDISAQMLDVARQNPALAGCQFYVSSGTDCGAAPDGAYDLVYSQLCFRYITSRSVRVDLIRAMARALRPGGVVMVEMRFFPALSAGAIRSPHVPWSADQFEPTVEAGEADVQITPDELHLVYQDFSRYFEDVRLQFVDVPPAARHRLPPQLYVSGSTRGDLAGRIHALPTSLVEVRR